MFSEYKGFAAGTKSDRITGAQPSAGYALAVAERPVATATIEEDESVAIVIDAGVFARYLRIR
jgi:hypothetical protein